jgi:heme exporter protein B
MPVITLAVPTVALYYHYLRQSLREALSTQYVRTARAKGLTEREMLRRHALPNALLPSLTILGIQFDLSADALLVLTGAILLGTPALSGIGAIGAALTLGLRGGGVLLSLLVLPLYIPVLIFGAGAVDATVTGLGGEGHLSLLAAITFASVGFAPWASAAALKIALE